MDKWKTDIYACESEDLVAMDIEGIGPKKAKQIVELANDRSKEGNSVTIKDLTEICKKPKWEKYVDEGRLIINLGISNRNRFKKLENKMKELEEKLKKAKITFD